MNTLSEFFERTKDYHILVVGDVMLDCYLEGRVDRISPEAPVPILQLQSSDERLGGAANVALNIRRLGAKASIMGIIGNDPAGESMLQMFQSEGINSSLISRYDDARTTVKTRVLGGHQHLLRIDDEKYRESARVEAVMFREKLDVFRTTNPPDAIILQDYNKGFLSSPMIRMLLYFGHLYSIPVYVDPKHENFFEYESARIFKPNLRELRAKIPFAVEINKKSLVAAAEYLAENLKCELCAITLSEHGIFLSGHGESGIFPTHVRKVVDVCGAGDAVISVLTLANLMQATLTQMATLANAAGGVVCGSVGVCPVDLEAMKLEIREVGETRETGKAG